MKKLSLSVFMCLFAVWTVAQIRGNNITVSVVPDRMDWTYSVGETVAFNMRVCQSGNPVPGVSVSYEMGPEMYPDVKKDIVLKDGTAKIVGKMSTPGFYRLTVTAKVGGREYKAWGTAAFSPEKIQPKAKCPKDFDEFWAKAIEQARYTSLEPTFEFLPEQSTKDVNTYHVSFQNDRWGRRVYGILNMPAKPGKYPAILKVPGAGVRPYYGDSGLCAKGVIVLEIGIHGIPVTNPQSYYDQIFSASLADYWLNGSNNRDRNYYKHVVTGCIRSIDFIESLSMFLGQPSSVDEQLSEMSSYIPVLNSAWDRKHLAVTGSSQGGFLTLATTALDKRVSCYVPVHAAMCDHEASLHKVACGWPHIFYHTEKVDQQEVEEMRYYDGVNFARRISVPGWFSFGFNDDVVAPTSMYGTYNVVKAQKELVPYQQTAHFWYDEQYSEWFGWILAHLK